jgi:hypothetical protein
MSSPSLSSSLTIDEPNKPVEPVTNFFILLFPIH